MEHPYKSFSRTGSNFADYLCIIYYFKGVLENCDDISMKKTLVERVKVSQFKLLKFHILKFLIYYNNGLLPNTFKSDLIFVGYMKRTKDLRSKNTFLLPRVNMEKIKFPNT